MVNTSSSTVGWFIEKRHNITQHFNLIDANEQLQAENARLRANLPESFYQLQDRLYSIEDTLYRKQYEYIPAKVINSSSNKQNNYLTLNKGAIQGIETGMGVISPIGAVGIVVDVSDHYSIVMTALSNHSQLNVKLKTNNEFWLLYWDGINSDYAQIKNVKRDAIFNVGDTVITRGGATQFPEGIFVGTIAEQTAVDGEQSMSLNVELGVNYNAIYQVYIIRNLMKGEQLEIEDRILSADEN